MQTYLIGASDVRYTKENQDKQFYVLRCIIPSQNYTSSPSQNLGYEQREVFVNEVVYEQAKAVKSFPVPVTLRCEQDPFKKRVKVIDIKIVEKAA